MAAPDRAAATARQHGVTTEPELSEQDENGARKGGGVGETIDKRSKEAAENCKIAAPITAAKNNSDSDGGGGGKERAENYVTKIKIYPVTSAFRPPTRLRSDSRTVSVISITSGGRGGPQRRPSRTNNRDRPLMRPSPRRYAQEHYILRNTFQLFQNYRWTL